MVVPERKERKGQTLVTDGRVVQLGIERLPLTQACPEQLLPEVEGRDSASQIWINNSIWEDLSWALHILENSSGVRLLKSITWDVSDATAVIYCDACPSGEMVGCN